jgi:hypothetical protein
MSSAASATVSLRRTCTTSREHSSPIAMTASSSDEDGTGSQPCLPVRLQISIVRPSGKDLLTAVNRPRLGAR